MFCQGNFDTLERCHPEECATRDLRLIPWGFLLGNPLGAVVGMTVSYNDAPNLIGVHPIIWEL